MVWGESQARDNTSVVVSKGRVFVDVWVKIEQGIPGHVPLGCQTVVVNDVWQRNGRQLLLCVGLDCMHTGLYRGTTYREKSM